MLSRIAIFASILFITHSSHAMEIVKKNYWGNDIVTQFIFTQKVCDKNQLPLEMTRHIKNYNIALKNKEFQNSSLLSQWENCRIPSKNHYYLTPEQMNLVQEIFEKPYKLQSDLIYHNGRIIIGRITYYYSLNSNKDYTLFLTLPVTLRTCLTETQKKRVKEISPESLARGFGRPLEWGPCTVKLNTGETIEMPALNYIKIKPAKTILVQPIPFLPYWTEKSIIPENKKT
jgi:hypothetical protein